MIFEDPTRKRWRIAVASFTSVSIFAATLFGLSAAASMNDPVLPQLQDQASHARATPRLKDLSEPTSEASQAPDAMSFSQPKFVIMASDAKSVPLKKSEEKDALITAYVLQRDSNSLESFRENHKKLDFVYPDWFLLDQPNCKVDERIDPGVTDLISKSGVRILARLSDAEDGQIFGEQVARVMGDSELRTCVADSVILKSKENGASGVLIDFQNLRQSDVENYLWFLDEFRKGLHARGMSLVVAVPSGSQVYPLPEISGLADAVMVVMYGEHYAAGEPGPLASQSWFEKTLSRYAKTIPKDKLLVGMGSYGMDWTLATSSTAKGLTYAETMSVAADSNSFPQMSTRAKNMTFAYQDASGQAHDVWFLDASTIWNQWRRVVARGALGVGVWRLGSEDPNVWKVVGEVQPESKDLETVSSLSGVYRPTDSEIYRIQDSPKNGQVKISLDANGDIADARYEKVPTNYVIRQVGQTPPDKDLVLAFYDGPDANWTPAIMDVLEQNGIPATFFVLGHKAETHPTMMQEIARRGYLIGNHGYGYGNLGGLDMNAVRSDVNTTQRLIENATKRHSRLFSASTPYTSSDASLLQSISGMGYVVVSPGLRVGQNELKDVDALVRDIKSQAGQPGKHVIALQNDGADQSVMVQALARLIPELKQEGYQFVRMDQAVGMSAEQIQPPYGGNEALFVETTNVVGILRNGFWDAMFWVFVLSTAFSVLRILFMSVFVIRSALHKGRKLYAAPWKVPATVLIPAYNEQETIIKTLASLQTSRHKKFEALVIDDGSTDKTGELVAEFVKTDSRFRLIQKPNGGKSTALNLGMRAAKHDIVVTIDADTILFPDAIDEMIKPFADPKVDAVCGNVQVGNVHNALTGFQALEYITAQNFDRRAFEELNAISVVPGATGAWRRDRVLEIGGYETDTLTEDADMTIKMLINDGKIVYAPNAKSITEAPDNLRDLSKQRFRWSFGTFQCLGKYTDHFFKGRVGWLVMPNIFLFQIVFPLVAPLGDILFVVALLRGDFSLIFYSYAVFTILDTVGSIFAFVLERNPKRLLLFVLIQRFFYRQFLYVTIFRAILAILRGRRYGWNKLKRTGTVLATNMGS